MGMAFCNGLSHTGSQRCLYHRHRHILCQLSAAPHRSSVTYDGRTHGTEGDQDTAGGGQRHHRRSVPGTGTTAVSGIARPRALQRLPARRHHHLRTRMVTPHGAKEIRPQPSLRATLRPSGQRTISHQTSRTTRRCAAGEQAVDCRDGCYPDCRVGVFQLSDFFRCRFAQHQLYDGRTAPGHETAGTALNGQWSMVNGQWSMVNGQWSTSGTNGALRRVPHCVSNCGRKQRRWALPTIRSTTSTNS